MTRSAGASGQLQASDVEVSPLTFAIATNGVKGQAVITDAATGAYTYTPSTTENGVDQFTFTASDGEATSSPAVVTVNLVMPQGDVSRTFSGDSCSVNVSIALTPVASVKAYSVEETLPAGVTPDTIGDNGVWDNENNVIRWGVFLDNAPRTLTYTITGDDGTYDISGVASFDGWNQPVLGENQTTIACGALRVVTPVFDPPGGTRVPVDVSITSITPDAEIRYTTDGTQPTDQSALYTAPVHIDQPVQIRAKAFKEGMVESHVADARYLPEKSHKAIILAGGGPYTGNVLWEATLNVAQYGYRALLYQGYLKEEVKFFSPVTDIDVDGNGSLDDIDGLATSADLQDAIVNWAQDAESLLIFLTDHGGNGTFQITPTDILSGSDLDAWLDALQATMSGPVVVITDSCRSGTFLSYLTPPAEKQRIVISSASDQSAWFLGKGKLSFSFQFWASVFGNPNLYDAYFNATRMMKKFQSALLDADGDGISGEDADRLAAEGFVIGRGAVTASVAPEIGTVSQPQSLTTATTATLTAGNITSLNAIERVWAVIVPPAYTPGTADDPVTDMTEIDLTDPDGDGTYAGAHTGFIYDGLYEIIVYAMDSEGLYSQPVTTSVAKNAVLPDAYEQDDSLAQAGIIVIDGPTAQSHNFDRAADEDWVKFYGIAGQTYTVEALNEGSGCDIVIQMYHSDGTPASTPIDDGITGDGEFYDWEITENGFYYVKVSDLNANSGPTVTYDLKVYRPIGPISALFTGTIINAVTGTTIGEALILTGSSASAISLPASGNYQLVQTSSGDDVLTVLAQGFASYATSISALGSGTNTLDILLVPQYTLSDVMALLQIMVGVTPSAFEDDLDVNGDGVYGMDDLMFMMQQIAGLR